MRSDSIKGGSSSGIIYVRGWHHGIFSDCHFLDMVVCFLFFDTITLLAEILVLIFYRNPITYNNLFRKMLSFMIDVVLLCL